MKTCIALLSVFASTAMAFAPAHVASRVSTSTPMSFEEEIGAQPPLGLFDPLGLLTDADQARFDRLRYVEVKHGRVCMLAVLGHIVTTAGIRLPGDIDYRGTSFESIPSGLGALTAVPAAGWLQMFFFIGALELAVMKDITGEGESVGDFRNGALDFGWDSFSPEEQESKLAIELNNGRAAQMGILALMVHEKLDGDPYVINSLLGSPVDF
ncbi:chloroplastic [Seminavis robusta]|uniref:Chloroplastic n=1 Tax=Seminavis robusta TaxID=568900 RepID=A0A9N8EBP5_9STRA|nr:chloroplastic [Seminavis robusta]|eukprot:Sro851_g210830.1 chloroplastic (211) ;mRNA; r:10090-10722